MSSTTRLRWELLSSFGLVFIGAVIVAVAALTAVLPVLASPAEGVLFVVVLIVADLLLIFLFGTAILRDKLIRPMEGLAWDAERIADGDFLHRIPPQGSLELEQLRKTVNDMADRLIADQERLARNIESLDQTNLELIRAQDQIIHQARLASVGTLAAGIAHEVGNPLGAIIAYSDVAKARALRDGGDVEILDSIKGEGLRIDRIVRGLLDYARPRNAQMAPRSPGEVLDRVRTLLQDQGKLDDLDDRWLVDGEVSDVVMEPQQLEQVLVNVALNAIDALAGVEDPLLTVSLHMEEGEASRLPWRRYGDPPGINYRHRRRLALDEHGKVVDPLFTADQVVVIEVEDNGAGIPEEDLDRIFDPFYTTKELGKGTGLGLSICARLVEGMGGRIFASNREGEGALFTIRLPGVPGVSLEAESHEDLPRVPPEGQADEDPLDPEDRETT
ncbi:MAG: ATP-binding protein [Gemmatimonadota bacterium]